MKRDVRDITEEVGEEEKEEEVKVGLKKQSRETSEMGTKGNNKETICSQKIGVQKYRRL